MEILKFEKVASLHHVHVWSLEGEHHVFTAHVKLYEIQGISELIELKQQIKELLENYPFDHHTVEVEPIGENCKLEVRR